ncbi:MAG TPA: MarR family EPS-associated transcriptional regulator, partial [Steroidobacteraceae bacterium]|nr:MarR family EPS-associated transcriptional regulator [Steroidobacteraceae bacterium]
KALVQQGWVKVNNFRANPRKVGYLYLLTPQGFEAKAELTTNFLRRKIVEYEVLKREIAALEAEAGRRPDG